MIDSSFPAEIDDESSACTALWHLLRTVPMDAETYSCCEGPLNSVLQCESNCLVMNHNGPWSESISLATSSRHWIGARQTLRSVQSSARDSGHGWQLDLSRSKRSIFVLLGALTAFALIGLGFFANREEDFARSVPVVTPQASDTDWIPDSHFTHKTQWLIVDLERNTKQLGAPERFLSLVDRQVGETR